MPGPNQGPTSVLLRGATLSYLAVMVALPLVVLAIEATSQGLGAFRDKLTDPFAWHALKLTFQTALTMVALNSVAGTATAWVLVRYDFPGKGLMNSLVDLPIAVPTVVTGLMLVALYGPSSTLGTILGRFGLSVIYQAPGIVLALLFVTYPFVVRSVMPVLLEMDRSEEEAAMTLGRGALDDLPPRHVPDALAGDPHRHGSGLQPGPGRVRQRGDGRRQPAVGDEDRADVRLRRDRERQPARRDGRVDRAARLLARCADRPQPAPAPRGGSDMTAPATKDAPLVRANPVARRVLIGAVLGLVRPPDPRADAGPGPRGVLRRV